MGQQQLDRFRRARIGGRHHQGGEAGLGFGGDVRAAVDQQLQLGGILRHHHGESGAFGRLAVRIEAAIQLRFEIGRCSEQRLLHPRLHALRRQRRSGGGAPCGGRPRLGQRQHQRHGCPTGGVGGKKLIVTIGEAAFEVGRADRGRRKHARVHVPGPGFILRGEQELQPFLPGRDRKSGRPPASSERHQRLARGISVRLHVRQLRPSAVGSLQGQQFAGAERDSTGLAPAQYKPNSRNA